jgi:hypothetical protein
VNRSGCERSVHDLGPGPTGVGKQPLSCWAYGPEFDSLPVPVAMIARTIVLVLVGLATVDAFVHRAVLAGVMLVVMGVAACVELVRGD